MQEVTVGFLREIYGYLQISDENVQKRLKWIKAQK